ncbi:MAG: GIY-YIG nuclease family protein [Gammaproteobacteria bacterium]
MKPSANRADRNWSVYIIRAGDGSLYTGISTDVERRLKEHREGRRGARFFNGREAVEVVWVEDGHTRSSASRREWRIKQLTRAQKLALVAGRSTA